MNIYIVYKDDYPWDVRVEKIAKTVADLGYDLKIIANNFGQDSRAETVDGLEVVRMPPLRMLPRPVAKLLKIPFWFNPLWKKLLNSEIENNSIIIVRDLPLIKLGSIISKRKNCKVIYDMAEVYPEMYSSMSELKRQSLIEKILKNPKTAQNYEDKNIHQVDHIFTMIKESRDRLLNNRINSNKISIVSNTPIIDPADLKPRTHYGSALNIVYVGFLTELRGLDLLIEGVRSYINTKKSAGHYPDIEVHIIGKGGVKSDLENLVLRYNLENYIKIYGWLSHEKVATLLKSANIGALTYRVCGHWNHTIPNKIFDYMASGLPVLSTEVIPIKRIITETNCGLITEANNPESIARSLAELENPRLREHLGRNGQLAISERYNWNNEKLKIKEILREISITKTNN